MKFSRLNKLIAGILIIFIGFGLLLDNLNLIDFNPAIIFPLIIIYFGMRLYSKKRQIIGGLLTLWGAFMVLSMWFHIRFDDVFGVLVSLGVVYFGFRLVRSKKSDKENQSEELVHPVQHMPIETGGQEAIKTDPEPKPNPDPDQFTSQSESASYKQIPHMRIQTPFKNKSNQESRSALIGDFHLTSGRFELKSLNIWHGIGDVIIDLSRALIQEEEAFLVINGWVGGITIYVPVDLPVSVSAEVTIGDMEVFGHRQGGLNRHAVLTAENYDEAPRKVKIIVSLIIGDIDVKYI
ncbi:cell wall-active antibiotics response protein LiaF [Brevibacillus ginsengisoli]|uniref:cell wall-active antibiotics response protein LiaF n=1 Tax=Brevibacillus ginsengisoli TaxID=363854 RepID=UPI003CF7FF6C